jgi:hypothetical protein
MTQRDWQKDMEMCQQSKDNSFTDGLSFLSILPEIGLYWLQEAKERGEREQRMKEAIEYEIEICTLRGSDARAEELKELLATIYPDTPAPKEGE